MISGFGSQVGMLDNSLLGSPKDVTVTLSALFPFPESGISSLAAFFGNDLFPSSLFSLIQGDFSTMQRAQVM